MAFPHEPAAHLLGSNGPVHAVAYSASPGTYILTGSADRSIRLYNPFPSTAIPEVRPGHGSGGGGGGGGGGSPKPAVPQGRLIQTYAAHGYEVLSLAVASDNESFVSGGGDRAVFLWDVARAVTTRRFGGSSAQGGHSARINCVSFAGAGDSLVVSGGFDTTVRLWDVRGGSSKPIQVLGDARDAVTSLVARGPEVVTGSVDGRVRSYDVRMGRCTTDVVGASVVSLDVTRDGRAALVGSLDSKLRLMDRDSGTCLRAYSDPGWRSEGLRVQSLLGGREKWVVAGDEMPGGGGGGGEGPDAEEEEEEGGGEGDGRIWAWDLLTGRLVAKVRVPWGPPGYETKRRVVVGRDGKPKTRTNVISCMAWREGGWGDQFCVGGTSGVVTVFAAS